MTRSNEHNAGGAPPLVNGGEVPQLWLFPRPSSVVSLAGLRGRIFAVIAARGEAGVTDDEGESLLGVRSQSYTPRRGELSKCGMVVRASLRRRTASGRMAAVWIIPGNKPGHEGSNQ